MTAPTELIHISSCSGNNLQQAGNPNKVTPPSSLCGSECLYNALPIHKFFGTKKENQPPNNSTSSSNSTATADTTKGEDGLCGGDSLDGENHIVPGFIPGWSCRSAAEDTVKCGNKTITSTARIRTTTAGDSGGGQRRTRFSFYDNTSLDNLVNLESNNNSNNNKKKVRFVTNIDSLFEESVASNGGATACSFASSLTTLSSQQQRSEIIDLSTKRFGRLTAEERTKVLTKCKVYRLQISTFEELYSKDHGHLPVGKEERSPLATVYKNYRAGKRAIRIDAACRIQSISRGLLVRSGFYIRRKLAVEEMERLTSSSQYVASDASDDDVVPPLPPGKIKEIAQQSIRELNMLKSSLVYKSLPPGLSCYTHQEVVPPPPPPPPPPPDRELEEMEDYNKKVDGMTGKESSPLRVVYTRQEVEEENDKWLSEQQKQHQHPLQLQVEEYKEHENKAKEIASSMEVLPYIVVPTTAQVNESLLQEGLTREMIAEYFTHEERRSIATRALTSKLLEKDGCKLPQDTDSPEAICILCEMPKLTSKEGVVIDTCVVCDELRKEIDAKQVQAVEDERLERERVLLDKLRAQVSEEEDEKREEERKKLEYGKEIVPRKIEEEKAKEGAGDAVALNSVDDTYTTPTVEEGGKLIEMDNIESFDSSLPTDTEEKEEFDSLLDDWSVADLQRKMRGVPQSQFSNMEAVREEYNKASKTNKKLTKEKKKLEKQQKKQQQHNREDPPEIVQLVEPELVGYGGFASKSDYDSFQQMYGEFEKSHADVVDYVRERVAHKQISSGAGVVRTTEGRTKGPQDLHRGEVERDRFDGLAEEYSGRRADYDDADERIRERVLGINDTIESYTQEDERFKENNDPPERNGEESDVVRSGRPKGAHQPDTYRDDYFNDHDDPVVVEYVHEKVGNKNDVIARRRVIVTSTDELDYVEVEDRANAVGRGRQEEISGARTSRPRATHRSADLKGECFDASVEYDSANDAVEYAGKRLGSANGKIPQHANLNPVVEDECAREKVENKRCKGRVRKSKASRSQESEKEDRVYPVENGQDRDIIKNGISVENKSSKGRSQKPKKTHYGKFEKEYCFDPVEYVRDQDNSKNDGKMKTHQSRAVPSSSTQSILSSSADDSKHYDSGRFRGKECREEGYLSHRQRSHASRESKESSGRDDYRYRPKVDHCTSTGSVSEPSISRLGDERDYHRRRHRDHSHDGKGHHCSQSHPRNHRKGTRKGEKQNRISSSRKKERVHRSQTRSNERDYRRNYRSPSYDRSNSRDHDRRGRKHLRSRVRDESRHRSRSYHRSSSRDCSHSSDRDRRDRKHRHSRTRDESRHHSRSETRSRSRGRYRSETRPGSYSRRRPQTRSRSRGRRRSKRRSTSYRRRHRRETSRRWDAKHHRDYSLDYSSEYTIEYFPKRSSSNRRSRRKSRESSDYQDSNYHREYSPDYSSEFTSEYLTQRASSNRRSRSKSRNDDSRFFKKIINEGNMRGTGEMYLDFTYDGR